MADYRQNYGATGAPLVVNDLVISGISGGDEGARGWLRAHPHLVTDVECADLGSWIDIDTPKDLPH